MKCIVHNSLGNHMPPHVEHAKGIVKGYTGD